MRPVVLYSASRVVGTLNNLNERGQHKRNESKYLVHCVCSVANLTFKKNPRQNTGLREHAQNSRTTSSSLKNYIGNFSSDKFEVSTCFQV